MVESRSRMACGAIKGSMFEVRPAQLSFFADVGCQGPRLDLGKLAGSFGEQGGDGSAVHVPDLDGEGAASFSRPQFSSKKTEDRKSEETRTKDVLLCLLASCLRVSACSALSDPFGNRSSSRSTTTRPSDVPCPAPLAQRKPKSHRAEDKTGRLAVCTQAEDFKVTQKVFC